MKEKLLRYGFKEYQPDCFYLQSSDEIFIKKIEGVYYVVCDELIYNVVDSLQQVKAFRTLFK